MKHSTKKTQPKDFFHRYSRMDATIKPNYKMNWYNAHKNDAEFMEKMRENKRRYYEKNKEVIKARHLAYYYAVKKLTAENQDPVAN